jgi:hypothetical protein
MIGFLDRQCARILGGVFDVEIHALFIDKPDIRSEELSNGVTLASFIETSASRQRRISFIGD